jgi:hypothetical protein
LEKPPDKDIGQDKLLLLFLKKIKLLLLLIQKQAQVINQIKIGLDKAEMIATIIQSISFI